MTFLKRHRSVFSPRIFLSSLACHTSDQATCRKRPTHFIARYVKNGSHFDCSP